MEKEVFEKMMREACESYLEDYDFSYFVVVVTTEDGKVELPILFNSKVEGITLNPPGIVFLRERELCEEY